MQQSLFNDWKHQLKLFGLGGAVKLWEDNKGCPKKNDPAWNFELLQIQNV